MALNLKTLGTRSASAVVFVILLIGSVYWNYYSFTAFFFIVAMLGLNEFYKIAEKLGAKPFKWVGFLSGFILYGSSIILSVDDLVIGIVWNITALKITLVIFPFIVMVAALFSKQVDSIKNGLFTICGILYAVLPFGLLNQTVMQTEMSEGNHYNPMLILGIIFLIWSNDTFAYLGGSLFGKNKMIERVSPGKTWEGTAIGVAVTFGLSFIFDSCICPLGGYTWPVMGLIVPVLATLGDLVESKLKREAGIKDSGNIMPGHGGILDRFDSLIFVSPFVYVYFNFFSVG